MERGSGEARCGILFLDGVEAHNLEAEVGRSGIGSLNVNSLLQSYGKIDMRVQWIPDK